MAPVTARSVIGLSLVLWTVAATAAAADFTCGGGDAACLVAAIAAANAVAGPSTIRLAAGRYTLRSADNATDGPNGLPSVVGTLTIQGAGARATVVERAADAPDFRIAHVAPTGALTLEGITLRGGSSGGDGPAATFPGGAILNHGGRLTLTRSRLENNRAAGPGVAAGGGLFNRDGTLVVSSSTLAGNVVSGVDGSGGGLATSGGTLTVVSSAVVDNLATGAGAAGGGIAGVGPSFVDIVNSTIARNRAFGRVGSGGGLDVGPGQWTITSSTIAGNAASGFSAGGGGLRANGPVSLRNTLVAQNAAGGNFLSGPDCIGSVTSLGHNLIGDPGGCTFAPQPGDRTGGPGLAIYTDDGTPGEAHWPLLPTSQAIGAGDLATCPSTDQLGRPRLGRCDIGAVQFVAPADPLAEFVQGFYRYALGREASPTEVAAWLSFLQASSTTAGPRVLTHAVFDGAEYRARVESGDAHVTALYRAILGRDPEPTGFAGWTASFRGRAVALPRIIIASPEFLTVVPGCMDAAVVRPLVIRLYQNLLRRSPGPTDAVETFVSNIVSNCGTDPIAVQRVVELVRGSAEYLALPRTVAQDVTELYRALLVRDPRPDEVAGWLDFLLPSLVEDQFVASPEFAGRWAQLRP